MGTTSHLTDRRADFPMLQQQMHEQPLIYFDTAATALTPQMVIDAISRYYAEEYGTVHRAVYQLAVASTERYSEARRKVARLLNARVEQEIIFTSGTTASINLVAHSLGKHFVNLGDEVLVSETAHHSNIVPWQLMCDDRGANLKVIPVDDRGVLILDHLEELLCGRTKLVAVGHISNAIGVVQPVREIVEMAHRYGAMVLIDGAQAVPHMPVDVQALGADFYAFSGHKLYGPTGIGVLHARHEVLERLPPYQGGGDMIEQVTFEETTYNTLPFRFEAGTPNIAGVIGLGAAIDYIQEVGLGVIHSWEQQLLEHATKRLQEIEGLQIIGQAPEKGALISFTVKGAHPLDIATMLDLKGICVRSGHHCAQPTMARYGISTTTRASFAFYNTLEEVDFFVEALKAVLPQLR